MLLNGCLLNVILATGCLQWPRVKNRTQNTKIFEYLFQSVPPVPTYKLFCKFSKIRSLKQEIPTRILEHSTPNSQRHPSVTRERERERLLRRLCSCWMDFQSKTASFPLCPLLSLQSLLLRFQFNLNKFRRKSFISLHSTCCPSLLTCDINCPSICFAQLHLSRKSKFQLTDPMQ